MSLESDLFALIGPIVSNRAYPITAPFGTPTPFVIWNSLGGTPVNFYESAMPSKRNLHIQVRVWSTTYAGALVVARSIENALVTSATLRATRLGEALGDYEDDVKLYGTIQDFSIWTNV